MFVLGILHMYILFNMGEYYRNLQLVEIKKLLNTEVEHSSTNLYQYFNLITYVFILIGFITPYYTIYCALTVYLCIGEFLKKDIHKRAKENSYGHRPSKGKNILRYIKRTRIIFYTMVIAKISIMFGFGLLYMHNIL